MRKTKLLLLCVMCVFFAVAAQNLSVETASASAAAEIVMEQSTGRVLEESNADRKLPMASTTKIMTALIIAQDLNLDNDVTVPDAAVGAEGSSIYLKKGEIISVRDLLYGLMLRSGNDAAAALAIIHSGSIEKFVQEMNKRAKSLGAENTNFCNPSGLPDPDHYTTARDLCTITRFAMDNATFKEVVSTKNYSGKYRSFQSKNKMLFNFDGANGVKTGYTLAAGRCLVSSAEREGMQILCVVLNCPEMYERSSDLLESAFNSFELLNIDKNRVFMCDVVPCKLQNSCILVVKKEEALLFNIIPASSDERKKDKSLVGYLEIFGANDLLLREKLYSI